MPKSGDFDFAHCFCCGVQDPEVQEGRTTCCRDFVCVGHPLEVRETGDRAGRRTGSVEACCAAGAFVIGFQRGLYPGAEGRREEHLTCSHGFCNLDLLALLDRASL